MGIASAKTTSFQLRAGEDFGKYRILMPLAEGGMAHIFLAVVRGPHEFRKLVVLKVPMHSRREEEDDAITTMFAREAELAIRLNHPNIVQAYDITTCKGRPLLVMEYLEGATLQELRREASRRRDALSLRHHVSILADILAGLRYAHSLADYDGAHLEVIHRDVSPSNVFVTFNGQTKLLDFGVAKPASADSSNMPTQGHGTLSYMSPEAILSQRQDRRSDLYSVGVLLWEALANRPMWTTNTGDYEVMQRIEQGQLPSLEQFAPHAPKELVATCMRALARAPLARFETASTMRRALTSFLQSASQQGSQESLGTVVGRMFPYRRDKIRRCMTSHAANTFRSDELQIRSATANNRADSTLSADTRPSSKRDRTTQRATPAARRRHPVLGRPQDVKDARTNTPRSLRHPRRVRIASMLLLCGFTAIACALLAHYWPTGSHTATSTAQPTTSMVTVTLKINPPHADVTFGGIPLDSMNANMELAHEGGLPIMRVAVKHPRDNSLRMLRANVPGYVPLEKQVVINRDLTVLLQLRVEDSSTHEPHLEAITLPRP